MKPTIQSTAPPTARRPSVALPIATIACVFLLTLVALLGLAGCATKTGQVNTEVAALNAAMVACPLEQADTEEVGNCWEDPARQIDEFIASNPDQPAITNALRLRQALLLTVYQQDQLATVAFSQVDSSELHTARDKAVYALRSDLTWWYGRAPNRSPLTPAELTQARSAVSDVDARIATLSGPDDDAMRGYLETTRVLMMLRVTNDTSTSEGNRDEIAEEMASSLQRYVGLLDDADRRWLLQNAAPQDDPPPEVMRRRVDAREIIRSYGNVARDKELQPDWQPTWVEEVME